MAAHSGTYDVAPSLGWQVCTPISSRASKFPTLTSSADVNRDDQRPAKSSGTFQFNMRILERPRSRALCPRDMSKKTLQALAKCSLKPGTSYAISATREGQPAQAHASSVWRPVRSTSPHFCLATAGAYETIVSALLQWPDRGACS